MAKKRKAVKKRATPVLRKTSVADAISEAFGEFESLGEEMRNWADSLEEKFSGTSKYEIVSSTADTLESLSEPTIEDGIANVQVEFSELPVKRRGYSRADRCGQACYILDQCMNALEENGTVDAEALRDELDNAKSEAEGVEFPGMYG